jgi:hypothetical protein
LTLVANRSTNGETGHRLYVNNAGSRSRVDRRAAARPPLNPTAARLHPGTPWSTKRYLNIELLKDSRWECYHRLSQCRAPLSSTKCALAEQIKEVHRLDLYAPRIRRLDEVQTFEGEGLAMVRGVGSWARNAEVCFDLVGKAQGKG